MTLFCPLVVYKFFEHLGKEHDLRGAVIVLDNHRAHKVEEVEQLLLRLGAETLFLPPASSVMNPIEVLWAVVKRRWGKRLASTPADQQN